MQTYFPEGKVYKQHRQSNFIEVGMRFLLISLRSHCRHILCQIVCNFHNTRKLFILHGNCTTLNNCRKKYGRDGLYEREVYLQELILPFLHPCNKKSLEG